jgi:hypothetical protein
MLFNYFTYYLHSVLGTDLPLQRLRFSDDDLLRALSVYFGVSAKPVTGCEC